MQINSPEWRKLLQEQAAACDIGLTEKPLERLGTFAAELLAWNQKVNLTAITEPVEVIEKHLIDSMIPAAHIQEGASVLDIGTGGGLPGVPLKILMPSLKVTMIDGSRKKISFVSYIIRQLGLVSAEAMHIRAEDLAEMTSHQRAYDVVICRAVMALSQFVALGSPFLKDKGAMIAMKGPDYSEELNRLSSSAGRMDCRVIPYHLPVSGASRTLIFTRINA